MLTLDDDEEIVERQIGIDEPPPRRSINLRPLVIGLAVVLAGGGLGTAVYFVSQLNTRSVIGMLDVADTPRLAMDMPGRPGAPKPESAPPQPGGLLTPPGSVGTTPTNNVASVMAPPAAEPPPEAPQAAGIAPMPQTPPPPKAALPAAAPAAPIIAPPPVPAVAALPAQPAVAALPAQPAVAALPAQPAVAALPAQPVPRTPDQAPSYAALPARVGDLKPLPPVPIEGLVQQSSLGSLPVIGRDGRQPWQAYARPFDDVQDRPRLGVVVVGLGLDKDATEAAIAKLPPEVTLAFSPYAGGLDKWIKKARDTGHEVLLALPAESTGYPARDPGPWGLFSTGAAADNIGRLEKVLARAVGYVGVWSPEGPFTRSPQIRPVLAALKERGLLYVGEGAVDEPRPPTLVPFATIDSEPFRDAIDARLAQAAAEAPQKGRVIVVASARPVSLDRLITFLAKLPDQGVALAPVSAVVRQGGKS